MTQENSDRIKKMLYISGQVSLLTQIAYICLTYVAIHSNYQVLPMVLSACIAVLTASMFLSHSYCYDIKNNKIRALGMNLVSVNIPVPSYKRVQCLTTIRTLAPANLAAVILIFDMFTNEALSIRSYSAYSVVLVVVVLAYWRKYMKPIRARQSIADAKCFLVDSTLLISFGEGFIDRDIKEEESENETNT